MSKTLLLPARTESTNKLSRKLCIHRKRARQNGKKPTLTMWQYIAILYSNNRRCTFCGAHNASTLEHVLPLSLGGNTSRDNCVLACHDCNERRERAMQWLINEYTGCNGQKPTPFFIREAVASYYGFSLKITCTMPNSATFR